MEEVGNWRRSKKLRLKGIREWTESGGMVSS